MHGITSFGCYLPRLRLSREAIVQAHAWGNRALRAHGKGERSMCNWDEDSVTMAVAAGRACLAGRDEKSISSVFLASTSLPFADRQNAGILANALMLSPEVLSLDVTSSQKAGTSGLVAALELAGAREGEVLFTASEKRRAKPASVQELWYGDGAAALSLGREGVLAEFLGAASRTVDFVDHYRGEDRTYDYNWEERWIRDEGYMKIVPPAINDLLDQTGVPAGDIRHFVMPCVFPAVPRNIAKQLGFSAESLSESYSAQCGEAGTAHPLLMLAGALDKALPGDTILLVGFGQGCDALLFRATDALASHQGNGAGINAALANRREETNYHKFLTFTHQVEKEFGIRAEVDIPTPLSALYRNKDMVLGMIGGQCSACGTPQFPRSQVCVNPECKATGTQEPYSFADRKAKVNSWTADHLTYTLDPPGHYGMVQFEDGGRFMADFTDVEEGGLEVGMPVRMAFRIKSFDERRGFRRYFWKAVPVGEG